MKKHPSAFGAPQLLLQFICAITCLIIGSFGAPASAQAQSSTQPDASQITRIEQYVNDVQTDPTADGVAKEEAARILASAKIMFEEAVTREENLKQYQYISDNSEEIITDLTANAAMIQINDDDQERDDDPITLQNRLTLLMAERASLAETESTLQTKKMELAGRPGAIAAEIVAANQVLYDLETVTRSDPLDPPTSLDAARSLFIDIQRGAQNALIGSLQAELVTLPARTRVNATRLALTEERREAVDIAIDKLRDQLSKTKLGIAESYVQAARSLKQSLTEDAAFLQVAAEENLRLAEGFRTSVENTGFLENQIKLYQAEIVSLKQSIETVEQVLGTGTLTSDMAALLRELRSRLPALSDLRQDASAVEKARVESQLGLIVLQDRQRRLLERTGDLLSLLKVTPPQSGTSLATNEEIDRRAEEIIQARLSILDAYLEVARSEQSLRVDEGLALKEVLELTSILSARLDRRFLFMRTSEPVTPKWLENFAPGIAKIFSPNAWKDILAPLMEPKSLLVWWVGLGLVPPSIVWLFRTRLQIIIDSVGHRVGRVETDDYWTTPVALLASLCLALPWPWLIGSLGIVLLANNGATANFASAAGQAFVAVSSILFIVTSCRVMARQSGVLSIHFGWSEVARMKTRRLLSVMAIIFGTSAFFFVMAIVPEDPELRYGVAIISFLVLSLAMSFLSYEFFKPNGGIVASIDPGTQASAWLVLSLPLLVGIPLVNGAMPLFGFLDTGLALQERVMRSVSYFVVAATLYGVAMRIFQVANRRIALRASSERQIIIDERRSGTTEASVSGEAVPDIPDNLHDAELIGNQVQFILLLTTGFVFLVALWFTWRTLVPALGIADEFVLWTNTREVGGEVARTPVTLWNLLVALFLAFGGFVLARNLRGVLEVGLFQRLGLDVGARYAAVTMAGYVVVGAGLVFGFAQLGLDWSKLQWIVAAFGVGLGFGLQEVLANFVSGLIILFERPIRVGDTVTIGDLTGTVSEIKIRATTITDFDNREVLLPNKTIITQNVSNWTLHNNVTRIVIPIGVAYGSDVEQVRSLLLKVARNHPDVLIEPQPTAFFMAHAESSLDFEVRVFVASILKRFPVRHELNTAINKTLHENGIEIPFPQRDLHLKQE